MKLRDILFLAIIAAAITLAGFITVPIVVAVPLPGIRMVTPALFYGIFLTIGVMRVRKLGCVFIPMFLNGLILLMMSPIMFINCVFAGAAAEGITLALFRGYKRDIAAVLAGTISIPLWFPGDLALSVIIGGEKLSEYTTQPWITAVFFTASLLLSFGGSMIGLKIGRELTKAGVLKVRTQ
jgi:energy-coupling factor transport system substrate-specific component